MKDVIMKQTSESHSRLTVEKLSPQIGNQSSTLVFFLLLLTQLLHQFPLLLQLQIQLQLQRFDGRQKRVFPLLFITPPIPPLPDDRAQWRPRVG